MTDKPFLSATQLTMYWRCPEQYRRRYVEHEKIPPAIAVLEGGAWHVGNEYNFKQKIQTHEDLPAGQIADVAVAAFDDRLKGGYQLTADETSKGERTVLGEARDRTAALATAHAEEQAPDYQPVEVEHTTRIVLPASTHDLLAVTDLRDDRQRVTDFKTAKRRLPETALRTSVQLTIYAAAYQVDHGQPPREVRLDVITKTKRSARQLLCGGRDREDIEVLANRINVTLAAIQAGSFPPCLADAWQCDPRWCGYYPTCDYVRR